MRPTGVAGDGPGDRRREDHSPARTLGQFGDACLNAEKRSLDIGVQDELHVGDRHGGQLGVGEDAGVGAEDVDAAVRGDRGGGHLGAGSGVGDVAQDVGDRAASEGRELLDRTLRIGLVAAGDEHIDSCGRQDARDSLADALGGTGDDGRAASDRSEHDSS